MDQDAEDGVGSVGAVQASNLNFTQTQAFQATQAEGGSQVPTILSAAQSTCNYLNNCTDLLTPPMPGPAARVHLGSGSLT